MGINTRKLYKELKEAGIPISSVNTDGVLTFEPEATQEQEDAAQVIVNNHDPTPTYDELRSTAEDGYGTIEDQLGMQYWDLVNGTTVWKDHVAAVNTRYPKPA